MASRDIHHTAIKINSLISEISSAAFNTKQYIVTIREELEYAKKFIETEKIKTNSAFDVI